MIEYFFQGQLEILNSFLALLMILDRLFILRLSLWGWLLTAHSLRRIDGGHIRVETEGCAVIFLGLHVIVKRLFDAGAFCRHLSHTKFTQVNKIGFVLTSYGTALFAEIVKGLLLLFHLKIYNKILLIMFQQGIGLIIKIQLF